MFGCPPHTTPTPPLATRNASPEMLRFGRHATSSTRGGGSGWRWRRRCARWGRLGRRAISPGRLAAQRGEGASPGTRAGRDVLSAGRAGDAEAAGGRTQARARASHGEGERAGGAGRVLVTREQVEELRAVVERKNPDGTVGITDDEIRLAEKYERALRHDVMAHVHALGDACPKARAIIHLGMTSQDVVCNADLRVLDNSIWFLSRKVMRVIDALRAHKPTRQLPRSDSRTINQPQPTTVGRRLCHWARS